MPPAISDEEMSEGSVDARAHKGGRGRGRPSYTEPDLDEFDKKDEEEPKVANGDAYEEEDDGEDDEDDDEEGEDVYVVEKILSHFIDDNGDPRFEVKWEGYEKKSDRTWEPEENLKENASVVLEEYLESIGGRDKLFETTQKALKTKKRGRPSAGAESGAKRPRKNGEHHPADTTPPASAKAVEWKVPSGSWEQHVDNIEVTLGDPGKDGKDSLLFYLTWKNGHKTRHTKDVVYKRCPQKMLLCYERHIRFRHEDDEAPAEGNVQVMTDD